MSTLIADRYYPESVADAPQRKKAGFWKRMLDAMTAGRMAQAQRAIYQYYSSRSDADLRELGVPEATIAHVRKYYG